MDTSRNRYAGRVVAVTGAGSGLGVAMAARFAAEGARLALLDIDGDSATASAAAFAAQGAEAIGLRVDVADSDSLAAAAGAVRDRFGRCDVLCANVGVQQFGAIDTLTAQDWQWVVSTNVLGTINSVAAFLPLLRAADGRRHIVLTASASFFQIAVRMAAYITTKYAVVGYGEVLRRELAPENINVSMLFPAGMMTRHTESSIAARPAELGQSRFDMADLQAMMGDAQIDMETHIATPDHAVRTLLDELDAGSRYVVTHGGYRHQVVSQQQEVLDAFDRMLAAP